jgi:hypothetical protein
MYGFRGDVLQNAAWTCRLPFYLLNAGTGAVVRHVMVAAKPWDPILVGPHVQRLYTMTAPDHINSCGPQNAYSPLIAAYDLRTGRGVAELRLKGVLAGSWDTKRTMNGIIISESWQPGIALSPDGSQLAVFDGHADTLTLIQARTLRVEGTEPLSPPQSAPQSVAAMLGLAPAAAEAKGEIDGANAQIQYTADGRSVILTGTQLRPDRRHFYSSSKSLGIRLVDVASGQIRAWLRDGKMLDGTLVAPDGSSLYSEVQGWTRSHGWQTTVRRHDPTTLKVLARRTFLHASWINLIFLQK